MVQGFFLIGLHQWVPLGNQSRLNEVTSKPPYCSWCCGPSPIGCSLAQLSEDNWALRTSSKMSYSCRNTSALKTMFSLLFTRCCGDILVPLECLLHWYQLSLTLIVVGFSPLPRSSSLHYFSSSSERRASAWNASSPFLKSPETFWDHFGCHKSLSIFATLRF